jgi:hypothetical protein
MLPLIAPDMSGLAIAALVPMLQKTIPATENQIQETHLRYL